MANDLNQCSFIGRLGADPETRHMPSGDAICNFRIAVGWKTKEKEGAEWVPCSAFGKLAEICGEYLRKGSQVFVQGRFRTRKYEKDGQDRYITEIVIDTMQMLGGKPSGDRADSGGYDEPPQRQQEQRQETQRQMRQQAAQQSSGGGVGDFSDDIPFAYHGFGQAWRVI